MRSVSAVKSLSGIAREWGLHRKTISRIINKEWRELDEGLEEQAIEFMERLKEKQKEEVDREGKPDQDTRLG